jgi:hypothetical protein
MSSRCQQEARSQSRVAQHFSDLMLTCQSRCPPAQMPRALSAAPHGLPAQTSTFHRYTINWLMHYGNHISELQIKLLLLLLTVIYSL